MLTFLSSLLHPGINHSSDTSKFVKLVLEGVVHFLSSMMPKRSAQKVVAIILLALKLPVDAVIYYSGFKKSALYLLRGELRRLPADSDFLEFVMKQCIVREGRGRKSPIKDIGGEIIDHVESVKCFTLMEIRQWIADTYGISVSTKHLSNFLAKNGIRKLKGGSIPAKADVNAQKSFYDEVLHPLMQKAGKGKHVLLFADASHFVLGCDFIGSVYGKVRQFARTYSGRKRYNVLGALDFSSKKVITVTNDTYINAASVCELLRKIRSAYKGKVIHLVLDNARYQKCSCVDELAKSLRINLHYLPPYSPNLNLIERLWKFTKFELRKSAWNDFNSFSSKIDSIIASTTSSNKSRMDRLIGEKVQLYDEYKVLDESTLLPPEVESKSS